MYTYTPINDRPREENSSPHSIVYTHVTSHLHRFNYTWKGKSNYRSEFNLFSPRALSVHARSLYQSNIIRVHIMHDVLIDAYIQLREKKKRQNILMLCATPFVANSTGLRTLPRLTKILILDRCRSVLVETTRCSVQQKHKK